jgi:aspartyl-tRNA(Asn)/glutamyl-tRNA(Gln) amidotransferase subunit B
VTDDSAIRAACQKVVDANPNEVVAFKVGKETLMGWFVGQVMREMKGKADAKITGQILKELLS